MKTLIVACVAGLALGGVAVAQGHSGHSGYSGYSGYQAGSGYAPPASGRDVRTPEPPKFPKPPRAPEFVAPPRFKPFTGQHIDPSNHGLDPYPKPAKPKGGFSTYGGR